eukprot:scaffold47714_cov39-Phaeocystis_antarctica.AAC.1
MGSGRVRVKMRVRMRVGARVSATWLARKRKRSSSTPLPPGAAQLWSAAARAGSSTWSRSLASRVAPMSEAERATSKARLTSTRSARTWAHSALSSSERASSCRATPAQPASKTDACVLSYGTNCQMSSARCGSSGARHTAKPSMRAASTVWHERRRGSSAAEM